MKKFRFINVLSSHRLKILCLMVTFLTSVIGFTLTVLTVKYKSHISEINYLISEKKKTFQQANLAIIKMRKEIYKANMDCCDNNSNNGSDYLVKRFNSLISAEEMLNYSSIFFTSKGSEEAKNYIFHLAKKLSSRCGKPRVDDELLDRAQNNLDKKWIASIENDIKAVSPILS